MTFTRRARHYETKAITQDEHDRGDEWTHLGTQAAAIEGSPADTFEHVDRPSTRAVSSLAARDGADDDSDSGEGGEGGYDTRPLEGLPTESALFSQPNAVREMSNEDLELKSHLREEEEELL
ncbi:MAG: hypothetical protein SGPRY_012695 [Prymnesium sp.]